MVAGFVVSLHCMCTCTCVRVHMLVCGGGVCVCVYVCGDGGGVWGEQEALASNAPIHACFV